jgi:hypothetical protein
LCELIHIAKPKSPDLVKAYALDLGLSKFFQEYYHQMVSIVQGINDLESLVDYRIRQQFRSTFYKEDLVHAQKFCNAYGVTNADKIRFANAVTELAFNLKRARGLLNEDDIETIGHTVLDVLSYAVKDPLEIWKESDTHTYVASFAQKSQKKFLCFVTSKDGRLFNAYSKKPHFSESEERYRIYTRPV